MIDKKEKFGISIVLKSGIWFTVCNILTKSIGFITTPIFTRLLTKSDFGEYNNFITWAGVIVLITSLNLEASLVRARFDFDDDFDGYVASMSILSFLSTVVCLCIMLLFRASIQELLSLNKQELLAMLLYLLFYPVIQLFQTKERFQYRYKTTVIVTLLTVASTAFLSVALVVVMENKLYGRIIGTVLPIIVIGAILWIIILKNTNTIKMSYWRYALPYALPFIPHLLSMYLLGSMDKVMIRHMCGSEDLAMYSLAYTVGTILSLLISSMNNAYVPWLGDNLREKNYSSIRKISENYIGFFILFAMVMVIMTPEVLLLLGGTDYIKAKYVIPQVFAGCIMQFIYSMYVNIEQYEKRTVGMAMASIIAAVFNFITNFIFIKKYGYIAASYTTFFSYFLLMILHIRLVKKIGFGDVYNTKKILIISLFGGGVLISMNCLFDYTFVRYLIFLMMISFVFIFLFLKRQHIMDYIRRR